VGFFYVLVSLTGDWLNCFHLSIPVYGADIPAPLVDAAPERDNSCNALRVGGEEA
jgi:hypothetical protein